MWAMAASLVRCSPEKDDGGRLPIGRAEAARGRGAPRISRPRLVGGPERIRGSPASWIGDGGVQDNLHPQDPECVPGSNGTYGRRRLLKFDVSGIPERSIVHNADLKLWVTGNTTSTATKLESHEVVQSNWTGGATHRPGHPTGASRLHERWERESTSGSGSTNGPDSGG
jgi:hypothetical protein